MEVKIYVVKDELYKKPETDLSNVLNENALNLLDALRNELINACGGLTVLPVLKGYWLNEKQICADSKIEIWKCFIDNEDLKAQKIVFGIILCIKETTKQKSQLYTVNRNIESYFE